MYTLHIAFVEAVNTIVQKYNMLGKAHMCIAFVDVVNTMHRISQMLENGHICTPYFFV